MRRFPVAVLKEGGSEDVTLTVRARPLSGKVGLWTKADSIIEFDDFTVQSR